MVEQADDDLSEEQEREVNLLANYRPIGIRAVLSACLAQQIASKTAIEPNKDNDPQCANRGTGKRGLGLATGKRE
ncbi:hypothetical protein G6L34_12585 [Agrobacterium tumefaciens]|nr:MULTISPECIES: hypothetical protein [Agrobacterium]MBO0127953.1 hypothetical protein [Agrobacterium sp. OT33]MCF1480203.1 hypothetical protein [Agrobacterium vitis]NTA46387.1 hypothetical protein [Agrobacterium tumefaciens]NTA48937.1 hypothetical protein [Agrobacterium tumefaciens]UXS41550.1 hypothetical protein FY150_17370 [Agrobacterium tumefaciens]